jgi:peptidyl-prolyl cis-trans isomerase B (cyclophilin B)
MNYMLCALFVLVPMMVAAQVPDGVTLENPKNPVVKMTTPKGEILLELFPETAPNHVVSFLNLTDKGYYNGLKFHRVVPGFVIQGGCPDGSGSGGPGYKLKGEFSERPHEKGTLAMARTSDPNSAGSQFYICLDRIPHLDRQYTVFGKVVKGQDVPEKIVANDTMKIEILQLGNVKLKDAPEPTMPAGK